MTDAATLINAIAALAWPAAVVVLVLVFRRAIAERFANVLKVRAAGAEIEFADRVKEAAVESAELLSEVGDDYAGARDGFLLDLAAENPRQAIRRAWQLVSDEARALAKRIDLPWENTKELVDHLREAGLASGPAARLILDLRSLRYDSAESVEMQTTPKIAASYIEAANNAARFLSTIAR